MPSIPNGPRQTGTVCSSISRTIASTSACPCLSCAPTSACAISSIALPCLSRVPRQTSWVPQWQRPPLA